MLADAGYDVRNYDFLFDHFYPTIFGQEKQIYKQVWMGSVRGTHVSLKHSHLHANGENKKKYWNFSWHEIATRDLPAFIDYILTQTHRKRLTYVGYSQGTTIFFVLTSMLPQYNHKISQANLLAPVAFFENSNCNWCKLTAKFYTPVRLMLDTLRIYKIALENKMLHTIVDWVCSVKNPLSWFLQCVCYIR